MNTRSLVVRLFAALTVAYALTAGQLQAQSTFNDATNDIEPGIATAGGTLDIVKMEVVDTETDVIFTMTLNGNTSTGGNDWGNFMIGIANQKTPGTTSGNGWGRPINLNAGVTNGVTNGMTHWIGSWVGGGGGSQLWTYGTTNWSQTGSPAGYLITPNTNTTITYTVSKASLGVTNGDTIIFDAYSSGADGNPSAVDALANPNIAITSWAGPYTSSATNTTPGVGLGQTRSYTLANTALNTTQPIAFQVDMRAQIGAGLFNPATEGVDVEWGAGFAGVAALTDTDNDGIYTGSPAVSAPANTPVSYRFVISPNDIALPLQPETASRTFTMLASPITIPAAFFNNIAGYRDVTFLVDMAAAQTAGAFNPVTQTVQVRGPFNSWAGTTLTNTSGSLYGATVRISGTADNQSVNYKYYVAASPQSQAIGFEAGADRTFNLAFNTNLNVLPALALPQDTFNTPEFRPVTFQVDMTVLEAAGGFTPGVDTVKVGGSFNNWDTGSTDYQLADEAPTNGVYTGTFIVSGTNGSSISYKFFNTRPGAPNGGYENDPNRTATLDASGPTAQVLPVVFWNNDLGETRNVTFRVDMSVQEALGLFDPAIGTVQVRSGSFGEGDARALTREGTTAIFSGTFSIPGNAGTAFQYKFWSPGLNFYNVPNNTGFEQINLADQFQNRSVTLDANGVAMPLPISFFSNQLFYTNGAAPNPFSTTQGAPSTAQSVTINGQGLIADITATAPTGFEVSSDGGLNYGPTANLVPVLGAVTGSNNLFVRIAASAAVGAPAGNISLTSTGSQSVSIALSGTVTAAPNGYSNWLTNYPSLTGANTNGTADPDQDGFDNNLEFSFDGNPTVGTPALMTVRPVGSDAVFNWVQRTSGVGYEVQKNSSLTNTWAEASGLSISNSTNQSGLLIPADYIRREFIVPASGKDFYRVRATITNN
jgi:hypothetical protein